MEVIDIKINEQKEELSKWKNELKKNLSSNSPKKEEIFLISKYWLDNMKKYYQIKMQMKFLILMRILSKIIIVY